MRFRAFVPALLVVALFVAMVAIDSGVPAPGLTPTASAQAGSVALGLDNFRVPYFEAWVASPHADITSRAFTNWSGNDPAVVPVSCAKCHSGNGFHDFLGVDGSAFGVVDEPAHPAVITCTTCHNDVTATKTDVRMPSGAVLTNLGGEAVCMECHQGRQSGVSVAASIERAGVDHDAIMDAQGFLNIHYYAAAATLYGSEATGGFEYPGKYYEPRFEHVTGYNTCQSCHDPHSLQIDVLSCSTCHIGVETVADLRTIRMPGSFADYDGDGDTTTGIYYEIYNMRSLLFELIQAYARDVVGAPIGYADGNPYFFNDLDGDGVISAAEWNRGNAYASFTPRLLAAAYNYQVTKKDPGAYAHNAKYTIQLIYDSIEDLAGALNANVNAGTRPGDESAPLSELFARNAAPVSSMLVSDMAQLRAAVNVADFGVIERLQRDDTGHFDASSYAWRYWDGAGAVPATCSTCHTATGLPFFLEHGVQIVHPPSQAMSCTTCHANEVDFALYEVASVTFPSGITIDTGSWGENTCAVCHGGRASGVGVDQRIGSIADDTVGERLAFLNIHYLPAAATRYGTDARGGYEYAGKDYVGFFEHDWDVMSCSQCHDPHAGRIDVATCSDCHSGIASVADLRTIRMFEGDFDGDGDDYHKGTYYEIKNLHAMLYDAILAYARDVSGTPIGYFDANPYFFIDTNADGVITRDEATRPNAYNAFTPRLLRAAYNYQFVKKDPGAYAHNPMYAIQLLHDSLEDLGFDVSAMERPAGDLY